MSRNTEIWKAIPGFARYEASDLGRIRNAVTGYVLTPSPATERRYLVVTPIDDTGRERTRYVHRLIAEAHLGSLRGKVVHHRNACPQDPRLENLEVVTQAENSRRTQSDGTAHCLRGDTCPELWGRGGRLNAAQVMALRRAYASKKRGAVPALAREYGVSTDLAGAAARGDTYRWVQKSAIATEIERQEAIALRDARKAMAALKRAKAARDANTPPHTPPAAAPRSKSKESK